ncbi:MAG: hypothetical protein JOY64_09275 [Alphaproteobacteria bacterium]|nr:hypothetical protein [Alphaproteobacteria bacterium]MBV8407808.1 hypothetical protein [Alphaproteobacteria bacterium]
MARVISIHEYELRPGVTSAEFERALAEAERQRLFELPGLREHLFVRGLKGSRAGCYAAIWIYESRAAWEALWGPLGAPRAPVNYPPNWKVWENTILAPLLAEHPDTIRFTSYEEV